MSVIAVRELPESSFSRDVEGERVDVRVWQVETDSATENEFEIAFATGLPIQGQQNDRNPLTFASRRSVGRYSTIRTLFTVTVEYSSKYNPDVDDEEDPLEQAPSVVWSVIPEERVLEFDVVSGVPIRNTGGDRFETPLMQDVGVVVLQLTRNEAAYNIATALAYRNRVNESSFDLLGFTVTPLQCKVAGITTPGKQFGYGTSYYPITYELHFRQGQYFTPDEEYVGWDEVILNQGFGEAWESTITGDIISRPVVDPTTGLTVSSPVLLDANGQRITDDSDPVYLRFATLLRADLSDLGLPEADI